MFSGKDLLRAAERGQIKNGPKSHVGKPAVVQPEKVATAGLRHMLTEHGVPAQGDRSQLRDPDLLTQTEARALAARLNSEETRDDALVNVALTVPRDAWGGHERGWTVSLVPVPPI